MKKTLLTTVKTSTILIGGALMAQAAWASGYHFGTQSVSSQATANASAAEAADPSTLFYNPAGLTKLEGTQATININLVAPKVKYSGASAEYPGGSSVQGSTSGSIEPNSVLVAPHMYASHQLNDNVALGLGIYVPFGSGTEYQRDSVLRYNLNELGLQSIAIQPTVAYKFNEQHSVALGLIAQNTKAHLRQYANFGATIPAAIGGGNGNADGYAKVKGDDWGFGYNLAWMWDINDSARFGVNYRSKISHDLQGEAEWKLEAPIFSSTSALPPAMGGSVGNAATGGVRGAGYVAKENASVKITTPESLSVHGMYKINPQWNVFGDVTWTRHSRFNQANLIFENQKTVSPAQLPGDMDPAKPGTQSDKTILTPQWRNTYKVALGASYQLSEPLQLRFGWAYDQSPVKNSDLRMSTLPDANRMWFSVGGKYDINKNNSINVAYSYLNIQDSKANVDGYCGGANAAAVGCVSSKTNGTTSFKSHAHILGMQYTYKF